MATVLFFVDFAAGGFVGLYDCAGAQAMHERSLDDVTRFFHRLLQPTRRLSKFPLAGKAELAACKTLGIPRDRPVQTGGPGGSGRGTGDPAM